MENMIGTIEGGLIGVLIVVVFGLFVGVLAKLLLPGKDPGGWIVTSLLGIAGSWVGHLLFSSIGMTGLASSIIGAILGAMLLLLLVRVIRART